MSVSTASAARCILFFLMRSKGGKLKAFMQLVLDRRTDGQADRQKKNEKKQRPQLALGNSSIVDAGRARVHHPVSLPCDFIRHDYEVLPRGCARAHQRGIYSSIHTITTSAIANTSYNVKNKPKQSRAHARVGNAHTRSTGRTPTPLQSSALVLLPWSLRARPIGSCQYLVRRARMPPWVAKP